MTELFLTVASLAAFVLALVGLTKDRARDAGRSLKGWATISLSLVVGVALGAVFAQGGIRELRVLELYPPAGSGALLGMLAGMLASGGKAVITGIQLNGATARAKAEAKYNPPAPTPIVVASGAVAVPAADEWQESTLSEMTRADWPAVPLDDAPLDTGR